MRIGEEVEMAGARLEAPSGDQVAHVQLQRESILRVAE